MVEIKVKDWEKLSAEEAKKITEGLIRAGALRAGDKIVPAPTMGAVTVEPKWDPIGDLCRAACDTAAGAAFAWCMANTGGAATAICIVAAEVARNECRCHC